MSPVRRKGRLSTEAMIGIALTVIVVAVFLAVWANALPGDILNNVKEVKP